MPIISKLLYSSKFTKIVHRLANNDPSLTEVHLNGSYIGDDGCRRLAAALAFNTHVAALWLRQNEISNTGVVVLATRLETNTSITELWLGDNRIRTRGATAIADALYKNSSIVEIGLENNKIGDIGGEAFARLLRHNHAIKTLHLHGNEIGDDDFIKEKVRGLVEFNKSGLIDDPATRKAAWLNLTKESKKTTESEKVVRREEARASLAELEKLRNARLSQVNAKSRRQAKLEKTKRLMEKQTQKRELTRFEIC